MSSYLEHAQQRRKQFEINLKSIKKSDFSSTHSYITECNELLSKYRDEFNNFVHQRTFGDISFEDYINCLGEYSQAQLFLEKYLLQ